MGNTDRQEENARRTGKRRQEPVTWFDLVDDRKKVRFLRHFAFYFIAVLLSAAANNHIFTEYQWWLVLSLVWGIIVLIHFMYLYIIMPRIIYYKSE